MPLRARALVLRTEPPRSRVSAPSGFDPIAGAPPASRQFADRLVARSPLGPRGWGAPRPGGGARSWCESASGRGRSPALADQLGVCPGRRILVPDELTRKHHAPDAAAVGEHGAEKVGRA